MDLSSTASKGLVKSLKEDFICRLSAPVPSGASSMEAVDAENLEKAKEAKRKGRFQIVENEDKARLPKSQVSIHSSLSDSSLQGLPSYIQQRLVFILISL